MQSLYPLNIHVISASSDHEQISTLSVFFWNTCDDVIRLALKSFYGEHVDPSEYALYETEWNGELL